MRSADLRRLHRAPARGFTLAELLVTVTILGLLMSLGIPQLMQSTAVSRLEAQADRITAALRLARSEAVKRGADVTLCASTDNVNCSDGGWETGFVLRAVSGGSTTVVEAWPAAPTGLLLRGTNSSLTLTSTGTLRQPGTVKVCGTSTADTGHAVIVTLTATARATRQYQAGSTCP